MKRDSCSVPFQGLDPPKDAAHNGKSLRGPKSQTEPTPPQPVREIYLSRDQNDKQSHAANSLNPNLPTNVDH